MTRHFKLTAVVRVYPECKVVINDSVFSSDSDQTKVNLYRVSHSLPNPAFL